MQGKEKRALYVWDLPLKKNKNKPSIFLGMAVSRLVIARGWIDLLEVQKVSKLQGTIKVAGDKSISHRAIMLSSISQGVSTIKGFLQGDDCNNTIACFRRLGVEIEK